MHVMFESSNIIF